MLRPAGLHVNLKRLTRHLEHIREVPGCCGGAGGRRLAGEHEGAPEPPGQVAIVTSKMSERRLCRGICQCMMKAFACFAPLSTTPAGAWCSLSSSAASGSHSFNRHEVGRASLCRRRAWGRGGRRVERCCNHPSDALCRGLTMPFVQPMTAPGCGFTPFPSPAASTERRHSLRFLPALAGAQLSQPHCSG